MNNLSVEGEFRYIVTWFNEWSELQREDFMPVLVSLLQDAKPSNNSNISEPAISNINGIAGRPMSLFQCRIKLINEWTPKWPSELKEKLKEKICEIDSSVGEKIINCVEEKSHANGASVSLMLNGESHCNGNGCEVFDENNSLVTSELTAISDATAGRLSEMRLNTETSVDDDDRLAALGLQHATTTALVQQTLPMSENATTEVGSSHTTAEPADPVSLHQEVAAEHVANNIEMPLLAL